MVVLCRNLTRGYPWIIHPVCTQLCFVGDGYHATASVFFKIRNWDSHYNNTDEYILKRKGLYCDEIFTDCSRSCQNENFQSRQGCQFVVKMTRYVRFSVGKSISCVTSSWYSHAKANITRSWVYTHDRIFMSAHPVEMLSTRYKLANSCLSHHHFACPPVQDQQSQPHACNSGLLDIEEHSLLHS